MANRFPKCVILAAGTGQRMKSFKPLVSVAGLPLIERAILTASEAGVSEFLVVTGNESERLEGFLAGLAERRGLVIDCLHNERWQEENGLSLLRAKEAVGEDEFILLMADHVIDRAIVEAVVQTPMDGCEVSLAVDSRTESNGLVDLDDVTRAQVADGRVVAIGKGLALYDSFDTGVFRCRPSLFVAAEKCLADGRGGLTDAVRYLADQGRVRAVDVRGRFWVDADTKMYAKKAEGRLFGDLGKAQDGVVSRVLNRPVSSRILTPLLLRAYRGITANQVSLLAFAVSLLAVASLFLRLPWLAGGLIHLTSLLDGSDGEIARLKKQQSRFGGFLDAVLDRYGDGLVLFAMFYYAYTSAQVETLLGGAAEPLTLVTGVLAISGSFMVSYTSAKSVSDLGYAYAGGWLAAGRGRDVRLLVLAIAGVAALVHPVAILVALGLVTLLTTSVVVRRVWLSWDHALGRAPFGAAGLRAVILDFDGTVADSMGYLSDLAVGLISAHHAVPAAQARHGYLQTTGMDFARQMEQMFPGHSANTLVVDAMEERKRSGLLDSRAFPDVAPALEFFRQRGINTFICSSTRRELVQEFVSSDGLHDLVDGVYGYGAGLTKDRQIQLLLAEHGIDPGEALLVGDSFADGDFSRRAGVRFIGLGRMFSVQEFQNRGMECVRDLSELTEVYSRWEEVLNFR